MTSATIRMRAVMTLMLVVSTFALGAGILQAQEGGRELVVGAPLTGELNADVYAQTYWFAGIDGQQVSLLAVTEDEGLALALLLLDGEGNLLAQTQSAGTAGEASLTDVTLAGDGRYFVTVLRGSGAEGDAAGSFELTLTATDATTEVEPVQGAGPTLTALDAGIQVSVSWDSTADLDLEVRDPFGNSIFWDAATAENAVFEANVNANCVETSADNPTERISWTPGASPVGAYEVIVYYVQGCDNSDAANLSLNITVNGEAFATVSGTILPDQQFLSSFVVAADGTATLGESGVNPGDALVDAAQFLTGQIPLARDESVSGTVDADNVFKAYSFSGNAGEIVSVRMDAVDGNLDTKLFLIDPSGNVVAVNDDALRGGTTNSEIANQTLVTDGVYSVVASRYGQNVGGTEGAYTLTLSGAVNEVPAALAGLDLPQGSVEISLLWNTTADLQLLVRDPSGAAVYDDIPRVNSGGELVENGNVNCTAPTSSPVSYVYWPADRLPPGTYEVEVWYQSNCGNTDPVTFNLAVRVNDNVILSNTVQPSPGNVYLTNFTVDVNGFASAGAGGFTGSSSMLDIGNALPGAQQIAFGDTVNGTINQTTKFVLYTFDGEAGDQVRVGMQATAGTLDTTLFLLSPDGAQLAVNDDAVVNETTNSLIDEFTLPADGTYIVVATHYGLLYGGTSGTYNLSLTRLN